MAEIRTRHRLQFTFSADVYERLTEMKRKAGVDYAELVRDALRVYEYLIDREKQGFQLVLVKKGKPVKAVKLLL